MLVDLFHWDNNKTNVFFSILELKMFCFGGIVIRKIYCLIPSVIDCFDCSHNFYHILNHFQRFALKLVVDLPLVGSLQCNILYQFFYRLPSCFVIYPVMMY